MAGAGGGELPDIFGNASSGCQNNGKDCEFMAVHKDYSKNAQVKHINVKTCLSFSMCIGHYLSDPLL